MHSLPAQRGHGPRGLITRAEFVIFGFVRDRLHKELLGAERPVTKFGSEIDFAMPSEAGAQFAVGREANLITGVAEIRSGEGSDKTNHRARSFIPEVTGWAVSSQVVGLGN